jgi:PPOX class probable F420-dependent enzyme
VYTTTLIEETNVATIPEKYLDLFETKALAQLATLMPDGSPQVSPVWVDYDGGHILINSAKGRVKDKNMRRDPRVALDFLDPQNPYRHLSVRGRVVEITEQGADAHIDKLAKKYLGKDSYPFRSPSETRVIYKIQPESANAMG